MKFKIIFLSVIFAITSLNVLSQDSELERYSFETQDIQQETIPYFGVGGGFSLSFHFANFDEVNKILTQNNFNLGQFDGQILLNGGEGMTGVVFIPNLRATVYSYGGSKDLTKDTVINTVNLKRSVTYSLGFTGFSIDYGIVPFKSLAILPGIGFGFGSLSLEANQTTNTSDWSDFKPENPVNTFNNKAESSFIFIKPQLNIEYALTNFLMFRASAAYNMSVSNSWKLNNNSELKNVPDGFNSNALQLQLGIFVGLFNY